MTIDELGELSAGLGYAGIILGTGLDTVSLGVFHGACDDFSVEATRPGDLVLTVITVIPDGEYCPGSGHLSRLDVEVPTTPTPTRSLCTGASPARSSPRQAARACAELVRV